LRTPSRSTASSHHFAGALARRSLL